MQQSSRSPEAKNNQELTAFFRGSIFNQRSGKIVVKWQAIAVGCVFIPFSVIHAFDGLYWLSAALFIFAMGFFFNAWLTLRSVNPLPWLSHPVASWVLAFSLIWALSLTILPENTGSLFWFYPLVVMITFGVPTALAFVVNTLIIGLMPWLHYLQGATNIGYTLRFFVTLLITQLVAMLILRSALKLQRRLYFLSTKDSMTGAENRHSLSVKLIDAIKNYKYTGEISTLVILDIDDLKTINDKGGHEEGDNAIMFLANTLKNSVREKDTLFRLGGDEFLILFNGIDDLLTKARIEAVQSQLAANSIGLKVPMTISVGISELSPSVKCDATWRKMADTALYEAKHSGKNTVCIAK